MFTLFSFNYGCVPIYQFLYICRRKAKVPETEDRSIDTERNVHEKDMTEKGARAQMSESYHEIFDTMMPPETAKARIIAETTSEAEADDGKETMVSCLPNQPSSPSR